MKKTIELAPMEGIITASFRKCYKKYFKGIDRYYTPFIAANQTHTFKAREKREFIPYEEDLVPQILTNDPDDLIWAMRELSDLGYKEVNLNIGCPSGTVVAKGKGAGMLKDIPFPLSLCIPGSEKNTIMNVDLILKRFPDIKGAMLGRGALVDPFLPSKVSGEKDNYDPNVIYLFLQDLWDEYASYLSGDRDILFKMKDLWNFLGKAHPHNARELKQIKKAKTHSEYDIAVKELLLL